MSTEFDALLLRKLIVKRIMLFSMTPVPRVQSPRRRSQLLVIVLTYAYRKNNPSRERFPTSGVRPFSQRSFHKVVEQNSAPKRSDKES